MGFPAGRISNWSRKAAKFEQWRGWQRERESESEESGEDEGEIIKSYRYL